MGVLLNQHHGRMDMVVSAEVVVDGVDVRLEKAGLVVEQIIHGKVEKEQRWFGQIRGGVMHGVNEV